MPAAALPAILTGLAHRATPATARGCSTATSAPVAPPSAPGHARRLAAPPSLTAPTPVSLPLPPMGTSGGLLLLALRYRPGRSPVALFGLVLRSGPAARPNAFAVTSLIHCSSKL
uniref:Uncharacterized protein n=1 Tax=Leersia perrieri TaxID=77586 RepID=A0A0D9XZG1_9ORYZ